MKAEGQQIKFPIKGIIRQGTDNIVPDGAMEEVIGMEYKDGSFLPYKETCIAENVDLSNYELKKTYVHKVNRTTEITLYLTTAGTLHYPVQESDSSYVLSAPIASNVKDVAVIGNSLCVATDNGIEYFLYKDDQYQHYQVGYYPQVDLRVDGGLYNDDTKNNDPKTNSKYPVGGVKYTSSSVGTPISYKDMKSTDLKKKELKDLMIGCATAALGYARDEGGLTGYVVACVGYRNKYGRVVAASAPVLLHMPGFAITDREFNLNEKGDSQGYFMHDLLLTEKKFLARRFGTGGFPEHNWVETSDYAVFQNFPVPAYAGDDDSWIPEGPAYMYVGNPSTQIAEGNGTRCWSSDVGSYRFSKDDFDTSEDVHAKLSLLWSSCPYEYADEMTGFTTNDIPIYTRYNIGNIFPVPQKGSNAGIVITTVIGDDTIQDHNPRIPSLCCTMHNVFGWFGDKVTGYVRRDHIVSSYAACNKLQYRIPDLIKEDNRDLHSICIFISPEISPYLFDIDDKDLENFWASKEFNIQGSKTNTDAGVAGGVTSETTIRSYFPKLKDAQRIIDDIKKIRTLHLVKEIKLDDIDPSNEWITIDLKGNLGDALLTREQLPITAFDRRDILPNHLMAYNYRLHQYDYDADFFKGHPLPAFGYFGENKFRSAEGGQYEGMMFNEEDTKYKWEAKVVIKDSEGKSEVVNYDNTQLDEVVKSMTPIITYPNNDAESIIIRVYKYTKDRFGIWMGITFESEFKFSHDWELGISYYISPDLMPIIPSLLGASPEGKPIRIPQKPYTKVDPPDSNDSLSES